MLAAREQGIAVRVRDRGGVRPGRIDDTSETVVKVAALAPDAIVLVDDGTGTPLTVRAVLQETVNRARPVPLAVRLDDRAGTATANALTALKSGVAGSTPPSAASTASSPLEDVLHLFDLLEIAVPADRDASARRARRLVGLGAPLPGRTYRLGTAAPTTGGLHDHAAHRRASHRRPDPGREGAGRASSRTSCPRSAAYAAEADARASSPSRSRKAIQRVRACSASSSPTEYGGMGGTLRDLAATTYTLGTVCGSTALAYFFHCSSSSRGMLPLGAIDAGLYDEDEVPVVRAFAEKVLTRMGTEGKWIGNFASESVKASQRQRRHPDRGHQDRRRLAAQRREVVRLPHRHRPTTTWSPRGATDVEGLDALSLFLVDRAKPRVCAPRTFWDGLGMRASGNHGIILKDVFVPDDESLTVAGGFSRATQVARGSWVGNQVAIATIYGGIARGAYEYALNRVMDDEVRRHRCTARVLARCTSMLIGETEMLLEEAHLWLRRQVLLETAEPEILPNADWSRVTGGIAKGAACERALAVTANSIKMCGTSGALMNNPLGRHYRDASMGLVQAFPAERGRLDFAKRSSRAAAGQGLTDAAEGLSPHRCRVSPTTCGCSAGCGTTSSRRTPSTAPRSTDDVHGGTPGPVPYEQLVYLDLEGDRFTQTNVVLRGRPPHARTFSGTIVDGVLVFDRLGPEAPQMLGCQRRAGRAGVPAAPGRRRGHGPVPRPRLHPAPRRRPAHPHHHALPRRRGRAAC